MKATTPKEILKKYWGFDDFRPMQAEIIESVLCGNDTLGLLPTGGGKSLTFQVPAMMLEGITLVITPLISLMKDQVDNLREKGIYASLIHSGLTKAEKKIALDRCHAGKAKMIYLSPEKLRSKSFLDELRFLPISLIVVDEAHCISQWGYDFRPSYLKIAETRQIFPEVPILALTASATREVVDDITSILQFRGSKIFSRSFSRENLSYIVRHTEDKEGQLLRILNGVRGSAIVYVRSRKRAVEYARFLCDNNITADYYHAGIPPEEKNRRQNLWKNGSTRVMVATNAFGMGIDKADVRTVIHIDPPSSLEEYYQEAGRAGRDGKNSWAVLLVSRPDKGVLTRRLTENFPSKDFIRRVYELACNFVDVAVGYGFNNLYDFNFSVFCERFSLNPVAARNAMEILTQAGWFEFSEELRMSARIMMLINREELYHTRIEAKAENVLNAILRNYTGIFTDYAYINEDSIAAKTGLTPDEVYESLLLLNRSHILHYIPRKSTPFLYFNTSREEPRHITIPREVYEIRKERMQRRIDSMKNFAFSNDTCRNEILLRYFGETQVMPCKKCDYCRAHKPSIDRNKIFSIEKSVHYLCEGNHSLDYILEQFNGGEKEKAIEYLRTLLDEGLISIDASNTIRKAQG